MKDEVLKDELAVRKLFDADSIPTNIKFLNY